MYSSEVFIIATSYVHYVLALATQKCLYPDPQIHCYLALGGFSAYLLFISSIRAQNLYKFGIRIILDIGCGKYCLKFNINYLSQTFGEKYCMLAGIYVFTGEDVMNAFKGKRKLGPLKKLNRPHHQEAFRYKTKS